MELTAKNVELVMMRVLFTEGEASAIKNGTSPLSPVLVEGCAMKIGFHPERLEVERETVKAWTDEFGSDYRADGGGGGSFLGLCRRKDGVQWGEHRDVDALCMLAIGLGLAKWCAPRALWSALPGGMPYIVFGEVPAPN